MNGIIYLAWGQESIDLAVISSKTVKEFGYATCLITSDTYSSKEFDLIIQKELPYDGLGKKALMYDLAPFDVNLYLDTDTFAYWNLDYGFKQAEQHGIALCIAPSPCLYYQYLIHAKQEISKDIVQYNSGVIFFKKQDSVKTVFDRWKKLVVETKANWDQHLFSYAFHLEKFNPFVLPTNWNYRPQKGTGPMNGYVRILHCKASEMEGLDQVKTKIQEYNNGKQKQCFSYK
jgi:hypothetical protein